MDSLPIPVFLDFPGGSDGKESCIAGELYLIPGLGNFPGERKDRLPTPALLGFPGVSDSKEPA